MVITVPCRLKSAYTKCAYTSICTYSGSLYMRWGTTVICSVPSNAHETKQTNHIDKSCSNNDRMCEVILIYIRCLLKCFDEHQHFGEHEGQGWKILRYRHNSNTLINQKAIKISILSPYTAKQSFS